MNVDRVLDLLKKADLVKHGGTKYGSFIRIPCPWRQWTHEDGKNGDGRADSYWIDAATGKCGCYACGDRSNLWELFEFLGILKGNESIRQCAVSILKEMTSPDMSKVATSFDDGMKKFDVHRDEFTEVEREYLNDRRKRMTPIGLLPDDNPLVRYIQSRGYEKEFLDKCFGVLGDEVEGRVVQPLWELYKYDLLGLMGRATRPDAPAKMKHYAGTQRNKSFGTAFPLAGFWNAKRLLLVEGQFDMYRMFSYLQKLELLEEVWPVSLNGSKFSGDHTLLLGTRFVPIICMFDNDKAGRRITDEVATVMSGLVPSIVVAGIPDGKKDPDEMTFEEVKATLDKLGVTR